MTELERVMWGEAGRWVAGIRRGSVLTAGGGLSSKDRHFLYDELLQTGSTTKRQKNGACFCKSISEQATSTKDTRRDLK